MNYILQKLGVGRLGRSALLSCCGLALRALLQAIYLIVLSRWMGPAGYGYFAGSVAMAVLLSPLAGWGVSYLVSRAAGSHARHFEAMWATALAQIAISGAFLVGALLFFSSWLPNQRIPVQVMMMIGIAELIALPTSNMAITAFLAVERGLAAAAAMCLASTARLLAAIGALAFGFGGALENAVVVHFSGSITAAGVALIVVGRLCGAPDWPNRMPTRRAVAEGTPYAIGQIAASGYQEIDKVLILQILGPMTSGVYTIAFRVVSILTLPVIALIGVVLPRMYAAASGEAGFRPLARLIQSAFVYYAVAATAAALLIAPMTPWIFGNEYAYSADYAMLLAAWIVPFSWHQYEGLRLTTSGSQTARSLIEVAGFASILIVNVALLERLGVVAAIGSLVVAEVGMAMMCRKAYGRACGRPTLQDGR